VGVRHACAAGRIDDRELAHDAPAVVEPEAAFGAAPDPVAGQLQRPGDVGRELRVIEEELEDVRASDERLAGRPRAHRGRFGDLLKPGALAGRHLSR